MLDESFYPLRRISLFLLRIAMGSLFFYAGITKILDSTWTSAGYLNSAKTLPTFYQWLASPGILPWVDLINQWGLTLLGASLILGLLVRFTAPLGALMMLLYYLPILNFPYVGTHGYIVDQHIIYIFALLVINSFRASSIFGIDRLLER
jgi:thiosulfate dehydrogenase [quinone] large subunit